MGEDHSAIVLAQCSGWFVDHGARGDTA